ncbi:Sfi1-domain-containing protein [Pyrenochaeta sp. DS3sAY3a]|nr:Sfi1-domain-containing protein [Pyrenochaeta sp. DS3sAY3a]
MLPSMTAPGYETPDLIKDDLTDEAIETLYEIVRRAQSSSDKSPRALFTAYEDVLRDRGEEPSDDAVYHRFLFRLQGQRRKDEALVQRFMRVLKDSFGIEVDIDEDGDGIEVTTSLDTARNGARNRLGRYSRRGSFDSFFDGTADKVAGSDYVDMPLRPRRASQGHAPRNGDYRRRATSDTEVISYQHANLPVRNRVNGYPHPAQSARRRSNSQQPTRKRSTSVSSRGSLQIRRYGDTGHSRAADDEAEESEYSDPSFGLDLSHIQIPGINAPIPESQHQSPREHLQFFPEIYRPSDTRLLDEAETFEQQRLHRVTRGCIQTWRDRTQQRLSTQDDMEQLAIAFDRKILLKLSFDQLRDTVRIRRSSRETERFFTRLETRADKARNLFLLTKAFTHWAKSAEDEVQRTSVARRHILRTRFFNGWRDITAVNELKIQHFVLAKFLKQWRARTATVRDNAEFAVMLYEENLVHRVYKEWFFKFCAIAAPAWRNDRTRRVWLQKWNEITKVLRDRESWATDRRERTILSRTFQSWQKRTVFVQAQNLEAEAVQKRVALSSALYTLQKQAKLAPLLRQLEVERKGRLLRSTLQQWQHASQLSRQARNVDQMRILRNAYTAWNDRLRMKALADRIDDRVLVECLYKWTLASRVSLFQRVHDRQLKGSIFLTWVTRTNQRNNTLETAQAKFAQFKRAQLLRMGLRKMEAVTTEKRREEFAVLAEYQQKLKQRVFERLKQKNDHYQRLKQWSGDARYYVLGKRTLKTWSEATQHARRSRRRDAYTQVRRNVKMNLVRRMFDIWKEKAHHIGSLHQQAESLSYDRSLRSSTAYLHQWHDRTITLQQGDIQATIVYNFKLCTRHFKTWSGRTQNLLSLQSQAVALRQESTELAAASALKRLGWRLWNIQRQEENARALYERNFEKHVRAMMRFWFEQTAERLATRPVSPTPTSRPRGGRSDRDDEGSGRRGLEDTLQEDENQSVAGDETRGLETWTAFDEHALGLNDNHDLSLSLSLTPNQTRTPFPAIPVPKSSTRPTPLRSSLRRPNTYPQPFSHLKSRPATILEDTVADADEDAEDMHNMDTTFADPSAFWTGTPMPPPPSTTTTTTTSKPKPGYLKTPSKRAVVRAKRPELGMSPEKRAVSPLRRAGAMSAPPGRRAGMGERGLGEGGLGRGLDLRGGSGVTSFERRLVEGGVLGNSRAKGKGKARVGFGYVSEIG